ncbi:MAG TPA: class E sortase, partial [Acidimicrobiia bacterium]|nr:class E sortase [Acidimicrobiia bacterium]
LDKVKKGGVDTSTSSPGNTTPGQNEDNPVLDPDEATVAQFNQEVVRGQPIAIIKIPKIGLDHVVISGTDRNSLQKGPGHYPATPLPGQLGNSAIAGHRTTYGSPFARLDELVVGDDIEIITVRGTFIYKMSEVQKIVSPGDVSVIEPRPDLEADASGNTLLPELTLTTCHPKFSAAKRMIVRARLVEDPNYRPVVAAQLKDKNGKIPQTIDLGNQDALGTLDSNRQSNILVEMLRQSMALPLLWWFLLMATVGGIWWYLFKRYHNWKVWFAGVLPFAIVLLFYFINLEKALPVGI